MMSREFSAVLYSICSKTIISNCTTFYNSFVCVFGNTLQHQRVRTILGFLRVQGAQIPLECTLECCTTNGTTFRALLFSVTIPNVAIGNVANARYQRSDTLSGTALPHSRISYSF